MYPKQVFQKFSLGFDSLLIIMLRSESGTGCCKNSLCGIYGFEGTYSANAPLSKRKEKEMSKQRRSLKLKTVFL